MVILYFRSVHDTSSARREEVSPAGEENSLRRLLGGDAAGVDDSEEGREGDDDLGAGGDQAVAVVDGDEVAGQAVAAGGQSGQLRL